MLATEIETRTEIFVCEYCGHENEVEVRAPGHSLLHRGYLRCGNCEHEQSTDFGLNCGVPLHLWYKVDDHWLQRY